MQTEVLAFLADTATHAGSPVTRIDTHAAIVFLIGNRAIKVKREVKLPFLDFSTLEQRRKGCELELAVNRVYAPAIYRRILPITRERDGGLALDGAGPPVEWALEMLRFDERATLDNIIARGQMNSTIAYKVATAIASSHHVAQIARQSNWQKSIVAIIQQNSDAFRRAGMFDNQEIDKLEQISQAFHAKSSSIIQARADTGFVRRCHGDLHLANIVLINDKPVLFDALEFDEDLATVDILYDLAFTLMDLVRHSCVDAANGVLNRYLEIASSDNLKALGLLPLFMSVRAAVRANVAECRASLVAHDQSASEDSRSYFMLALSLLQPLPPCLVAVGGLSGTGKTAVARELAPRVGALPGAVILRSDVFRKRMLGAKELDRLPASAYTPAVSAHVYKQLATEASTILQQGHSVILDAVFASEGERSAVELVAKRAAVPFAGIYLVADRTTRIERIRRRVNDASDATAAVADAQETYEPGRMNWSRVDATGTLRQTAALCTEVLPQACTRCAEDG
jgi:aminoglycoside phosphotransferase family enzyme/predicted kinase